MVFEAVSGVKCLPKFDFVPSQAAPAYFTTEHLVGAVAPSEFEGLQVLGSYGDAWLIESHYVPLGYVIVAATGGLTPTATRSAFASTSIRLIRGCAIFRVVARSPDGQLLCARVWGWRSTPRRSRRHAGDD